jgi:predicted transcriptional regulator
VTFLSWRRETISEKNGVPLKNGASPKNGGSQNDERIVYVFMFFRLIFAEDVRFKIIDVLAKREGANLREIARCVGISHKNLARYLDCLIKKGVIDAYPVGLGMKVYRLSPKYDLLRKLQR